MPVINMRSSANLIKGHGVASCFDEQVSLVTEELSDKFTVRVNSHKKCDIAHYHTVNPNYYIEHKLRLKKSKTAAIGFVHFLPETLENSLKLPGLFTSLFRMYLLDFYNSMDFLVTVNPSIVKKLEELNVTKPKILYIPNYVSEENFYPQDDSKKSLTRKKYDIRMDDFLVLGAGQLQRRKGVLDFVEVAKRMPHTKFVWAGGFSFGMITDGYEEIKTIMENPPPNLRFLGIVDRAEMADIYNMSDLLFLPSYDELFPMTILEAISCKIPLLLRDVDIYPGILFDGYLKAKNNDGFISVINKLSSDKEAHTQWKEKAWACHRLYSKENVAERWKDVYMEAYAKFNEDVGEASATWEGIKFS